MKELPPPRIGVRPCWRPGCDEPIAEGSFSYCEKHRMVKQ